MEDQFTFAATDSKIGMSALDSDVPNAGSMTFLCLLWISPINDATKRYETRKKGMASVKKRCVKKRWDGGHVRTIDRDQSLTTYQRNDGRPLFVLRVLVTRCMINVLKGLWIGYQEVFLL